jgi:hypothetical protein
MLLYLDPNATENEYAFEGCCLLVCGAIQTGGIVLTFRQMLLPPAPGYLMRMTQYVTYSKFGFCAPCTYEHLVVSSTPWLNIYVYNALCALAQDFIRNVPICISRVFKEVM